MSIEIHPTAIVHPNAKIGEGTRIGAFAIIDGQAVIGKNCKIHEHAIVRDHAELGDAVEVFSFAAVGNAPQHLKYNGEPTRAVVGDRTIIRESATINRGTEFGGGITRVGTDCLIMAYCHVAHDCTLGDGVILANDVQIAGHCEIGSFTSIGGVTGITQHVRIGNYAYIGGGSLVRKDVAPFLMGKGNEFHVQGVNVVGLTRRGFTDATVTRLRKLYKIFFMQHLTVSQAIETAVTELGDSDETRVFLEFVKGSKLGLHR